MAAYIEELQDGYAPSTVNQHLAAIRTLFDYLVVGQVLPVNPAASVRGPKHVIKKGKTPVLTASEARACLTPSTRGWARACGTAPYLEPWFTPSRASAQSWA